MDDLKYYTLVRELLWDVINGDEPMTPLQTLRALADETSARKLKAARTGKLHKTRFED